MLSGNFIVDIQSFLLVCIVWVRTRLVSREIRGFVFFPSKVAIWPVKVSRVSLVVIVELTTIRNVFSIEDISSPELS